MKTFLALSLLLAIVLTANRGQAAFYTVTGTADNTDSVTHGGSGTVGAPFQMSSLRGAIIAANANAGADTITLPAGTYTLTIANTSGLNEDACLQGDLDVTDSLTINGAGAGSTIVQAGTTAANGIDKVFAINPLCDHAVAFVMSGVTVRFGRNTQTFGAADFSYTGGGIDFCGHGASSCTLKDCVVANNSNVNGYGGGMNIDEAAPANSVVTLTNTTFANNTSGAWGGGLNIFGDDVQVTVAASTFSGNQTVGAAGAGAQGGGINIRITGATAGTTPFVTIKNNSVISNNTARAFGGGVSVSAPHAGPVTIQDSTISENTVLNNAAISSEGGGLYNQGLATVLTNVVVANNHADTFGTGSSPENPEGGGVLIDYGSVTITGNSYITNNTSVDGAGIFNRTANSTNSVTGATIAGNLAKNNGGGVCVLNGVMTLSNSTLLNNIANSDNAGGGDGGAIAVRGGTLNASFCRVVNNAAANGNAVARSAGTATVTNIWWGTDNPAGLMSGTVGFTPWLQLAHTANPSTILVPNSTTLTATFLANSAGTAIPAANLSRLIGLPITFNNPVRGTLSGAQTTIQAAGTATATFTANAGGAGSADAVVDNQATTASITIPTGVSSINRVQSTPTSLASVQWTVTFTSGVSGLAAANFSLVNGGLGGSPGISSVVAVGATPATSWTVTASTGSGTGTLGLNMVNGTSVSAAIANLPFTGEVYTIDLVAPDTSITAQPPGIANGTSASFSFTGSDTGVGVASFQYQLDGAAYVTGTSPVNLTGLSEASHTFNVRAIDGAGNADASPASVTWTVDMTPPSIAISAPSASTLHFGGLANYTVTYGDTHFNSSTLTAGNVTLNKTGSANGTVVVAGSGTTRTVSVTSVSGSGTLGISIAAGTATDTANNAAPAAGPSSTFSVVEDDFGDAPAPYPTLLEDNGARHTIPVGGAVLFLGTVPPDGEADGQPNPGATGDGADEDGVTLPASIVAGQSYTVTVVVAGSGGKLSAWIDWNRDGDWADSGEQIVTDMALTAGTHPLTLTAPAFAAAGTSFARFRLSTQSGLAPTGQADDGEVEDYQVTLSLPAATAPEIAVEQPAGTDLTDGVSTIDFGPVTVGSSSAPKSFTIRNTGTANLTVGAITKDGSQPGDFTIDTTGMSASVTPGNGTTFTVTFTPSATSSRSAALHIANDDSNENPFDIGLTGTGTSPGNQPPLAPPQTFVRAPGLTLKIKITDVLAACSDPDGGTPALDSVGASVQGATISTTATHILYALAANDSDSFPYTISDGQGGTTTGTITVQVVNPGGLVQTITSSGGSVTMNFAGIPGYEYDIQRAADPGGPWTTVDTQTAPANGLFSYTETPPGSPAFYRLQQHLTPPPP